MKRPLRRRFQRRWLPLCAALAVIVMALPLGTSLAGTPATDSQPQIACPTNSSNRYLQGAVEQWDFDNPVRPAWNNPDKNIGLRGYAPTDGHKDFVTFETPDPEQPPQFATLFVPYRVPWFMSTYRVYEWHWAASPNPGSRGAPTTVPYVSILGLLTTPGEALHAPVHGRDVGVPVGFGGSMVVYADHDTVALAFTRSDSAANGYILHIDGICTDPNLLRLYNSLDTGARYRYGTPRDGVKDYDLPALVVGQTFGYARTTEIRIGIADTGTFQDPRSMNDWWLIRPERTGERPGPTLTPLPSNTPVPTKTRVPTKTPTPTITPTRTPTPGPSPTPTPTPVAPPSPTLLTPRNTSAINDDSPILAWKPPLDAVSYFVQIDDDADFSSPEFNARTDEIEVLVDPLPDGLHYWHVMAYNVRQEPGSWSAIWRFTVDTKSPLAPKPQQPANGVVVSSTTPTVVWRAVSDATSYQIQIAGEASFATPLIDRVVGNISNFTVSPALQKGSAVYWRVRAQDAAGNWSTWSTAGNFQIAR